MIAVIDDEFVRAAERDCDTTIGLEYKPRGISRSSIGAAEVVQTAPLEKIGLWIEDIGQLQRTETVSEQATPMDIVKRRLCKSAEHLM